MKKFYLLLICFVALQLGSKAQDRIYWGVPSVGISSARFDGSDIKQAITLSGQTYDMETDFYNNVLYWGDGNLVKKANADGTNVQTLYTDVNGTIGALALDLTNNKLYFSRFTGSSNILIMRCNLDGTGLDTVVTSPNSSGYTYTLSISPSLQKLYWTEEQSGTSNSVLRSNLDGSNVETLMTVTNFMPGLSIDEKNQKLYLAYWRDNQVMTTDMTCSTTPTLVFDNSNGTFQMAVNNQEKKLYFAEMSTFKIRKCNLDGTSPEDVISLVSANIMALSIPTVPAAPTIVENETDTLKIKDFLFSGVDQDSLTKIQITSLPAKGTLYIDANNNDEVDAGEAIVVDQEITKTDIESGLFKFNPVADDYGTPYASFIFKWYNGISYSSLEYTQYIYVIKYIAGDVSRNGVIDGGEIAGDVNKNGVIDIPSEVAGDVDGNGTIDYPTEIAGDLNGNGVIDTTTEVAGDVNGDGTIDRTAEVAGDVNGDGQIVSPELAGDINGDESIVSPELLGDLNGNGILDDSGTGIKYLNANGLAIYPTITSDYINILARNNAEVTIYSVAGSLLLKADTDKINIGALGKGTYIVQVSGKSVMVIVK